MNVSEFDSGLSYTLVFVSACEVGSSNTAWKTKFNASAFLGYNAPVNFDDCDRYAIHFFEYLKSNRTVSQAMALTADYFDKKSYLQDPGWDPPILLGSGNTIVQKP